MSLSLIYQYFPDLSDHQKAQIEELQPLYKEWNDQINVISRKDIDQLYERHVLHSLSIVKYQMFHPGTKFVDIGTGGGFPGIPLAILLPDCSFFLVDSIGKKIKVVEQVAQALELANIRYSHDRAEKINEQFDFIISRAVAPAKIQYQWTHRLIRKSQYPEQSNGYLLLKGGDLDLELKELRRPYSMTNLSDYFDLPFFETKKLIFIPQ